MSTESVTETTVECSEQLILPNVGHKPSTEGSPSDSCKTLACWDVNVALVLVVLAGFLILVLFYCILLLRHKLHLAQAGNALEYFGFYHMANYTLKHPHEPPGLSLVNSSPPVEAPSSSPPPPVVPSQPVIPPLLPLPPPPSSRPPSILPLPHPIIYTTPPSPQSDAEVYSRIGTVRPSRHSSMSQTQVVLFEHSSL
ncbi:hypothetical protein QTP70_001166 [Hemibagrus guttatus]|uniref:Uncharacterized protein n=1 Tax=Hemibagrus guttatus TaxID=175788 RepID=A0AAE0UY84_9TELE|nr:hypothetical protein QTP70_001166 [Hemibagrus guttatus]KAK3554929.1 hypothetical protein QTP86_001560 [Hemibagrus guttatus]